MVRKTNNSSQSLPSAAAQSLALEIESHDGQVRGSNRENRRTPPTQRPTRRSKTHESSSSDSGTVAGSQTAEDEGEAADVGEDEEGEPDAFALSVRAPFEDDEQAGPLSRGGREWADVFAAEQMVASTAAKQSDGQGSMHSNQGDDDDDYAAVDDISDSSGSEAGAEAGAEQDLLQEAMHLPSFGLPPWHGLPDGVFGASETYFDRHFDPDFTDLSNPVGNDTDHPDWGKTLLDTSFGASSPVLEGALPHPSRRVRFQSHSLDHEYSDDYGYYDLTDPGDDEHRLNGSWVVSDESRGPEDQVEDGLSGVEDRGSASGYESDDGGTTDEEDPPTAGRELCKAPHLLRRPSLSSLDLSPTSYVSAPPTLETPFKVPSAPASCHRKGRKRKKRLTLGTFQSSATKPYAMINGTGDNLLIRPATRPSPLSTHTHSRAGSQTSLSSPATPVTSQATVAAVPDLSETEFTDAAASRISADPVLSKGPDFVASAGFTHSSSYLSQLDFLHSSISAPPTLHGGSSMTADLPHLMTDDQNKFYNQAQNINMESIFAETINLPDDIYAGNGVPTYSASVGTDVSPDTSSTAMNTNSEVTKASPTSGSSSPGIDVFDHLSSFWPKSSSGRLRPRTAPSRPSHEVPFNANTLVAAKQIHLSSETKKRKSSESYDNNPPPARGSKRRAPAIH